MLRAVLALYRAGSSVLPFGTQCRCQRLASILFKKRVASHFSHSLILAGKKEDPGNYRLVTLTLICGEVLEQLILETISRHRKVIKNSLHGFTKGMSCLTNPDDLL